MNILREFKSQDIGFIAVLGIAILMITVYISHNLNAPMLPAPPVGLQPVIFEDAQRALSSETPVTYGKSRDIDYNEIMKGLKSGKLSNKEGEYYHQEAGTEAQSSKGTK
jgi:hypothetical protein